MGTNYYLHEKPACECCGREYEALHIGKSSGGWCFSLHVIPEVGINSLDDWRARWSAPGVHIQDEYGSRIEAAEMEAIITERSSPYGLRRHGVDDRHCVGQGEGTWDYITGEFS